MLARRKTTKIEIKNNYHSLTTGMMSLVLAVVVLTGHGCSQQLEMCANRPWPSSSRVDRTRVVDAALGSTVSLLCNYCGENDRDEARFWYMAPRHSSGSVSQKEVTLGMADLLESNRLYMKSDHSLVVQDLTMSDVGRYSCSGLGSDGPVEFALDLLPINGLRPLTASSMSDWSRYESLYLEPVTKRFPGIQQMEVDWDDWYPCDGCAGKRYRRAACRVRFENGTRMACRSINLLATVSPALAKKLSLIPDFLLTETCFAYCRISKRRRFPKYRNTFVLEEGSSLTLVCAEATADKKVMWRRDGLLLTDSNTNNDSGPSLDVFGTLYLSGLTSGDSGNYTCFINGNRTQEVILTVHKSSLLESKAYLRHLYYLYYVFVLYFVVFGARMFYAFLSRHDFLKITENDVLAPEVATPYLGQNIRIR